MSILSLGKDQRASAFSTILEASAKFKRSRQRRHEIWVLTCYVNFERIRELINKLRDIVRITDVYLAFDVSEVFREGPLSTQERLDKISTWCEQKKISFDTRALNAPFLVHSKGYAIIQRVDDEIPDGVVLVTSANFTDAGFFGTRNVELGYVSRKKSDLRTFEQLYDTLWDEYGRTITEDISADAPHLFRYALLTAGTLLHKWDGSLSQMVGMRYLLTDLAKKRSSPDPELVRLGIETGDTFTHQVLDLEALPSKSISASFIRAFTIETYCGRWCPEGAWAEVCAHVDDRVEGFFAKFRAATSDDALDNAVARAHEAQARLIDRGFIKRLPPKFNDTWRKRIIYLRENKQRLLRLFTGYESFELPYDATNQSKIEELYDSLVESIKLSDRQNVAMKKVQLALNKHQLKPLALTQSERLRVQEAIREA